MVFENVPGLLSSDGWGDFGTFLGALGKCGYGFAYRVLDAQFAGVPQRRPASSLSDILETGALPQRYFLSRKACRGILRRAAKRGKELPRSLKWALEQIATEAATVTE
jgi:hypothetical protein